MGRGEGRVSTSGFLILGLNQEFSFLILGPFSSFFFFISFLLDFRKGWVFIFLASVPRDLINLKGMGLDGVAFLHRRCKLCCKQTPC